MKAIPTHNMLLVIGDFNAHIGSSDMPYTYYEHTNKNGQHLLDLAVETSMFITNTMFQKKAGKLWTFCSDATGIRSQIDYILINGKWKNSVRNIEAYNSFATIGSDHRVLTARINTSFRTAATPPRKDMFDWSTLSSDKNLQDLYNVEIKNRFQVLNNENESVTETYQ